MHEISSQQTDRLLRLPEVETLVGLRKSAIYAGMKSGDFPACVKLGPRAAAWPESEIQAWIQTRIRASRRGSV